MKRLALIVVPAAAYLIGLTRGRAEKRGQVTIRNATLRGNSIETKGVRNVNLVDCTIVRNPDGPTVNIA